MPTDGPEDVTVPASKLPSSRPTTDADDSLLQSLQALLFHMQAAHDLLPGRPADAQRALALALESGDSTLARSLDQRAGRTAPPRVRDDGAALRLRAGPRRLLGLSLHQQLRVLCEALSLALLHSHGKHIEVNVASRRGTWVISVRPHR